MILGAPNQARAFWLSCVFLAGCLIGLLAPLPLAAQSLCAMRGEVSEKLLGEYTEKPISMGLANNGGILEVFTSPTGNSWTIVITTPDGVSCLMASGEYWGASPAVPGEES